ncbi:MAG: hypothetical protein ACRD2E_08175 [Terriglobales bacterium]
MSCGRFIRELEQYLSDYSGPAAGPAPLPRHAQRCRRCARRWETARVSQALLASLRPGTGEGSAADPYFYARLQARIAARQREQLLGRNQRLSTQLGAARRDLIVAAAALALTFGSFCFGFSRTEAPSIAEAVALDVPHVHPHHPVLDHGPGSTDVLLSLLNR